MAKRQNKKTVKRKNPNSFCSSKGLVIEILLSLLFALLLGVVGMLIALPIGAYSPNLHWGYATGYEVSGVVGWFIGVIAGTIFALFIVSKWKKQKGCFRKAAVGGILGAAVSLILLGYVFPYAQIFFLLSAFPMAMAMVGYHWTSARKEFL
ncbi:hypothetical protein HZA99_00945 [Candidatus Woesearchaeota archaeon]|nr:hypothetical protein [Candidatus Woesearchaeota archaeon]